VAEDRLYGDPALVRFYDAENGWAADTEYCRHMADGVRSVLDLGCGTGLLLAGLDRTPVRVGVDPAGAMLDVARARPGGVDVEWIEGDARSVRLGRRFDLIVLTGHAFQVFLTDDGQRAVCRTIAEHLSPEGRFIFDSREPAREEWREWTPGESFRIFEHPELGSVESWNDVREDDLPEVIVYETHYRTPDGERHWSAESRIRFAPKETIERALIDAGLVVETWLGDWAGGVYDADSLEIIPIGRLGA